MLCNPKYKKICILISQFKIYIYIYIYIYIFKLCNLQENLYFEYDTKLRITI